MMMNQNVKREKGATMLEYALLLSLLCVVAIPAVVNLGASTDGTLSEVSTSIEGSVSAQPVGVENSDNNGMDFVAGVAAGEVFVAGIAGPPPNWKGGPAPFAHGNGWHAIDINEPMVLPAHASGNYQIYTVWTTGVYEGSYYMNYFRQNPSTGEWTQYAPGVHPDYSVDLMAGAAGEWISFYDIVPWLEGSNYPRPSGGG